MQVTKFVLYLIISFVIVTILLNTLYYIYAKSRYITVLSDGDTIFNRNRFTRDLLLINLGVLTLFCFIGYYRNKKYETYGQVHDIYRSDLDLPIEKNNYLIDL
jgi:hypothetical protein